VVTFAKRLRLSTKFEVRRPAKNRRYVICAVLCAVLRNSSRTRRVRSRYMRDARPSLFIFAVLSAVLRSGFRDTGPDRNPIVNENWH